jgi:anti-anti-sigma factor
VVQPAIDENRDVTLDLSELTFLDSSGVQAFIGAGQRAALCGVAIVLRSPSPPALRVLEMVDADSFAGVTILREESI